MRLDSIQVHFRYDTVVVAFNNQRLRTLMMRSMRRHNHVFDAFSEPFLPYENLLDVPCFIRFLDYETYQANAESIIKHYRDRDITSTPPLIVYGKDTKLFSHALIIDAIALGADYCRRTYRNARGRAKRKQEAVCF